MIALQIVFMLYKQKKQADAYLDWQIQPSFIDIKYVDRALLSLRRSGIATCIVLSATLSS